jgi:hypothetical protein
MHPCQKNRLGYISWHHMAALLTKWGVKQKLCPICARYKFPSEECKECKALKGVKNEARSMV